MTRDEVIYAFETIMKPRDIANLIMHDGFDHFVLAMGGRQYGTEATINAWAWFRTGWDTRDAS